MSRPVISLVTALLAGVLFGAGLILAGMANPAKVLGFLDLAGAWDPSLALVMGSALAVSAPAFWLARKRRHALNGEAYQIPVSRQLDRRLVLGAIGFGIGWGLAGFCPGPALVAAGALSSKGLIFTAAMLAGMTLFEGLERRTKKTG